MNIEYHFTQLTYLIATALFVFSLKWLSHPKTARRGVFAESGLRRPRLRSGGAPAAAACVERDEPLARRAARPGGRLEHARGVLRPARVEHGRDARGAYPSNVRGVAGAS